MLRPYPLIPKLLYKPAKGIKSEWKVMGGKKLKNKEEDKEDKEDKKEIMKK